MKAMNPRPIAALLLAAAITACAGGPAPAPPPPPAGPPPPVEIAIEPPPSPPPPAAPPETAEPAPAAPRDEIRCQSPEIALSLVLDRSGSMTGMPMEMAKAAATETAKQIGDADLLEVIAFDSAPDRAAKMRSGRQRASLIEDIARIKPGGGTEILSALNAAHEDLSAVKAPRKHIILLTDGMAPVQGIRELVRQMAGERITISTIALGTNTDASLLQEIAAKGSGRFHPVVDPSDLPAVFKAEFGAARCAPLP